MADPHRDAPWWLLVGGLGVVVGGWLVSEGVRSKSWPTVDGTVTESDVALGQRPAGDRTNRWATYHPVVRYRYKVNDSSYTGKNITMAIDLLGWGEGAYRDDAVAVAARYPVGAVVTVHYKPSDPAIAVLEPGASSWAVWTLIGGALSLGVGAFRRQA